MREPEQVGAALPGTDASGWEAALRPGAAVGGLELVREIGRGGFGVVWEARDRASGRSVAFKAVLDGAGQGQERLLREAEVAARLSHPNVVTLLDVGRSEHGPYLVLELLRGGTLAERLARGPLPAREALRVGGEMAKGLAHAHAQGIAHRDVKPGNVFLCEDGQVKLLDLGMARAFGRRTVHGGTPSYMAPEQWRGAPEDERTDVFALGVVLFQMLARELPFPDDGGATVRGRRPAPRLEVPGLPALGALVGAMLAKDPVERPRDAGQVLASLLKVHEELERTPALEPVPRAVRPSRLAALAGSPRALAAGGSLLLLGGLGAAAGFALRTPGAALPVAAGLAVVAALSLGALALTRDRSAARAARAAASPAPEGGAGAGPVADPSRPSIAVLRFADLSPGKDQEHFSDGVAEEILNALTRLEGLRVAARTSSFRFQGRGEDARDVGRALGVGAVVDGTVRTDGARVRISAQLISVADGLLLWSETYDRELTGVFAVQDEIARSVAAALKVKLLPGEGPAAGPRTTTPEAYGHYLRGRQLHNRGTPDGFRSAAAAHEQALALDPSYAPAWSGLAIALAMLWSAAGDEELAGVPDLRRRALEAADRAVALDPRLPDGHAVRATLRAMTWDWRGAELDVERALALDPGDARALRTQGWLLAAHGRVRESIDRERRAGALDPLNPAGWVNLASRHLALGDLPAAREAIDLAREVAPVGQPAGRAQALVAHILAGDGAAALATAEELPDEPSRLWGAALAHHALGHEQVAVRTAEALAARFGRAVAYSVAQIHAFRGNAGTAFEWLERAFARKAVALESVQFDALLAPLRPDPRYQDLLRRMRLIEGGGEGAMPTLSAPPAAPGPSPTAGRLRGGRATAARLTAVAAERLRSERALAGGSSGQTMHILADAVAEAHQSTFRRWRAVVAVVAGVGLVTAGVLSAVVMVQRRELRSLFAEKERLDKEIAQVQSAMEQESDAERLDALEQRLGELTGSARSTLGEVARKDEQAGRELAEAGDDLDRAIRRILAKFDAETYAVPPVFKSALQEQVSALKAASNLKFVYGRRNRYWPAIAREFAALGLPEEMAYIAWAETQFDPSLVSPAGAKGMWQMTAGTARELGLRVDERVDERLDVSKQTRAAARKLANLLAEFGSDSFMLALASYNRGEAGVRRVLHEIAQEKGGFRKEKRDFWHLYRLKRLPAETMDYVPRVLAAAVVCNDPQRYGLEPMAPAGP